MTDTLDQLTEAVSALVTQLALLRPPSSEPLPPVDTSSVDFNAIEALCTPASSSHGDLASLLGESRVCLQLALGFLGAVRDLPSPPASITFDVPGPKGRSVPVTLPPAAVGAITSDARRLAKALAALRPT